MADQETTTFDSSFAHELSVESWTMYGVGMAIVALRMLVQSLLMSRPYRTDEFSSFARLRYAGWKKLFADDYLIVLAAGLYTGLVVCLNVIADGGGSNLYPPGADENFTPEDIRERIYGSKIVLVSEQVSWLSITPAQDPRILWYHSSFSCQRVFKDIGCNNA